VVGRLVSKRRALQSLECLRLSLPLLGERLDELRHQGRQIALAVGRMLAPDDLLGHERHVIADEDAAAEADRDAPRLLVPVA
jgi:hypothetical protein